MPAVRPGGPIAPGIVPLNGKFPQYGVGGGTPGSSSGWNVIVANNDLEKTNDLANGYDTWFTSRSAASNFISNESSTAGSGNLPGLTGIDAIGDFFHRLTEGETWTRVGEVVLGVILLYAGVKALTGAGSATKAASSPVKKAAKAGASIAVPEARLASRVAAKRIAPKTTSRVAAHRTQVAKYGGKSPAVRESHIYHHKAGKK